MKIEFWMVGFWRKADVRRVMTLTDQNNIVAICMVGCGMSPSIQLAINSTSD